MKAGGLLDDFGLIGGAELDHLQDRCPAFAFAPDELNPIQGPGRGLRNDPHEFVQRIDVLLRFGPGRRPIIEDREVGVGRLPRRHVEPHALARLVRDRESNPPPLLLHFVAARLALAASSFHTDGR